MTPDDRSSGILLSVSSLPGPYGIGTMGAYARRFVDFLADAGQHYWQILPLVPPGDGASPYMSPSAFAGNPYFIDLDELAADGLLTPLELKNAKWNDPDRVDYSFLAHTRMELLHTAWKRSKDHPSKHKNPELPWLKDYARFAALHDRYQTGCLNWPKELEEPSGGTGFSYVPSKYLLSSMVCTEEVRQSAGHPHYGRYSILSLPRQRGGVEAPRAVSAGRGRPPCQRGRRSPGRLLRGRPALGQPPVRLGRPQRGGFRLLGKAHRLVRQAV